MVVRRSRLSPLFHHVCCLSHHFSLRNPTMNPTLLHMSRQKNMEFVHFPVISSYFPMSFPSFPNHPTCSRSISIISARAVPQGSPAASTALKWKTFVRTDTPGYGKLMGKWWEMIGKSWENRGNMGNIVGKKSTENSDQFGHVWMIFLATWQCELRKLKPATALATRSGFQPGLASF